MSLNVVSSFQNGAIGYHEYQKRKLKSSNEFPQIISDIDELQKRAFPLMGKNDTFRGSLTKSVHQSAALFRDEEIHEQLNIIKKVKIGYDSYNDDVIYAKYTEHGKAIIQQRAIRSCTAAVTAMLILDNGKIPNLDELVNRNLGNHEIQLRDIENAGLIPVTGFAYSLLGLKELLFANGSCIVSIEGSLHGHDIIVDNVSEDLSKIRLRDSYHGWEITVKEEAFIKEWKGGKTIQIARL